MGSAPLNEKRYFFPQR